MLKGCKGAPPKFNFHAFEFQTSKVGRPYHPLPGPERLPSSELHF